MIDNATHDTRYLYQASILLDHLEQEILGKSRIAAPHALLHFVIVCHFAM